jgi:4-diphosphocytidyl-2-C-methyl-D-erythritol kinase
MTSSLIDIQTPHVTVKVPAKINLQLSVGPLMKNGYHEIATIFQAISLYDEVTVSKVKPGAELLSISGAGAEAVPTNQDNLANKAIREIAKYVQQPINARVHINKTIPIAGGMAGGSANAAAVLVAVNNLWRLELDLSQLSKLASNIGSDVAFLLYGQTQMGLGRGEKLTSVLTRGSFHWVIATNEGGLSTPEVYKTCDEMREGNEVELPQVNQELVKALAAGDAAALAKNLTNDLQAAAIALKPQLKHLLQAGEEFGAMAAMVSGSGPTCVFLTTNESTAQNLAVDLSSSGLCKSVFVANGPVAGAKIISS